MRPAAIRRAARAGRDRGRRQTGSARRSGFRSAGWVANRSAKPSRGLSMHISMTAEVAPSSSPRPSILRSAEIMASGSLVSSTEPASARYSRFRDNAKRITTDSSHATATSAMAMTMAKPPPPLPRSPSLDRPPPPQRQPPWNTIRNSNSAKKPITPAITVAITNIRTSRLRIWVSSWPSTASISLSSRWSSSPLVTVMEYCRSFRPLAKALSALSSVTFSFGMVMPREMQRFSRIL